MGSCLSSSSSQKHQHSHMKSTLPFVSKTHHLPMPSPVKHKSFSIHHPPINDFGSKDEAFFDSNVWLDSDCDEDFLSVNGEFTPSQGNTPVHNNFTTQVNKTIVTDLTPNAIAKPSPTDKKHKLSDLFKESLRNEDEQDTSGSQNESPYASSSQSCEKTPSENFKVKSLRSMHCCLPSLRSERKKERKKRMSPVHSFA